VDGDALTSPAGHLISSASGPEVRYLDFVVELAPRTDIWQRMQTQHVSTADGCCAARICGRGGYGTPFLRWPCAMRRLADWASDAHYRQSRATRRSGDDQRSPAVKESTHAPGAG
jgi:hypothetical protein